MQYVVVLNKERAFLQSNNGLFPLLNKTFMYNPDYSGRLNAQIASKVIISPKPNTIAASSPIDMG